MQPDRTDMTAWTGRTDPEPDSDRWHQRIQALQAPAAPGLAVLGFACDEGVRRNQGRVGAADGPQALRRALANLPWLGTAPGYDAGDVVCADADLSGAQARLAAHVQALLDAGHFPIVLGGGHEIAFATWSGLAGHLAPCAEPPGLPGQPAARNLQTDSTPHPVPPRIGIINFDAHFDLRDPAHVQSSGTPFAQIAEQCKQRGWPFAYACIGVSRASNTRALFARAAELGVLVREDREIRESTLATVGDELHAFASACDAVYVTIDIDVLPAAEAPGVSAPAAHGVAMALLEPLLARVMASGKVRVADLAELNPRLDIDNRTARAAARLIHGMSQQT